MYRLRPDYEMHARPIGEYPARCRQAAAVMLMIQNNLDPRVAQHPHELITYGGNGAVFQNWAQYRLAMQYLSEMTENQTLVMYSGHPPVSYTHLAACDARCVCADCRHDRCPQDIADPGSRRHRESDGSRAQRPVAHPAFRPESPGPGACLLYTSR